MPNLGRIGLWTSCSQAERITPTNPMGLRRNLLVGGPILTTREEWIPALKAAAASLGYAPDFLPWMWYGQKIIGGIMAADSLTSLIKSGTGHPHEYLPAAIELKQHCRDLIIYHGAPSHLAETPTGVADNYAWLYPTMLSGAIPAYDAMADKMHPAMMKLAARHKKSKQRYWVEPFVKPGTQWAADETPCCVLLPKVRSVIAADWSPAQGAVREYRNTVVMIGDQRQIEVEEVRGFLAKGWNVLVPVDTDPAMLANFYEAPPPDTN